MKRSPLRRKTYLKPGRPLRSGSGVARHTPMKRRKVSRRFAKRRCQPFTDWLREQPCMVTGNEEGAWTLWRGQPLKVVIDPAHLVRGRGAGASDLGFAVPLAHHLHEEQHRIGIKSWLAKYGLTVDGVKQVAELYAAEWRATQKARDQ